MHLCIPALTKNSSVCLDVSRKLHPRVKDFLWCLSSDHLDRCTLSDAFHPAIEHQSLFVLQIPTSWLSDTHCLMHFSQQAPGFQLVGKKTEGYVLSSQQQGTSDCGKSLALCSSEESMATFLFQSAGRLITLSQSHKYDKTQIYIKTQFRQIAFSSHLCVVTVHHICVGIKTSN